MTKSKLYAGLIADNANKLTESLKIFSNIKNLGEKKLKAKINSIKYTKFRHHLILKKSFPNEN